MGLNVGDPRDNGPDADVEPGVIVALAEPGMSGFEENELWSRVGVGERGSWDWVVWVVGMALPVGVGESRLPVLGNTRSILAAYHSNLIGTHNQPSSWAGTRLGSSIFYTIQLCSKTHHSIAVRLHVLNVGEGRPLC